MAQYSAEILRTLSDQVQNLAPLRESYKHLQQYYRKLSRDFDQLLTDGQYSQNQLYARLKYLQEVHHELQRQFAYCAQELRQLQCQQAKLIMERNQQVSQSQALQQRQQLELHQKKALEEKHNDWMQQNNKMQFSIAKYKEMIHAIQIAVKTKQFENSDIEREIKKMEMVNQRITQLNSQTESSIDQIHLDNQNTIQEIQDLQDKLNTYDRLIQAKNKLNKENSQILINKTEELQQLTHRKQYVGKLIETERNEQKALTQTSNQLQSILAVKKQKLNLLLQENREYERQIQQEKDKRSENKQQFNKLTEYLQTLVHTNQTLFRQLQKSCSQDRQVQLMLSEKLQKLICTNDKMTQNQILNRFDTNISCPKNTKLKGYDKVVQNEVKVRVVKEKLNPIEQRVLARSREKMSSTWGSLSKQNSG